MRQKTLLALLIAWATIAFPWTTSAQQNQETELTVFAAASLNEAFHTIAEHYQSANPGERVAFNFAGSQQLVQQLSQGAPADIFASANFKQMYEAVKAGRIDSGSVAVFAHNRLVLVFPKENAAGLHSLRDLSKPGLKIILADKTVPAGQYAFEFLDKCDRDAAFDPSFKKNVLANVVSYEENVRAVLSKIVLGEADAGVVYVSDIGKAVIDRVGTMEIPDAVNVIAVYPLSVIRNTEHPDEAKKFVRYVLSGEGQAILSRFGFIPVSSNASIK